jgi:molecular chaperone GrpE
MNANVGNREASQREREEQPEIIEIPVKDKRRFTADGEPIAAAEESNNNEPAATSATSSEIEMLQAKLQEVESKRAEAERQVRDFSDRFRKAQEQLKAENEEFRARQQRSFEQRLETARGDIIAGLLDTLDNLKRAVAAAEKSQHQETDFNALLEGVKATASIFETRMLNLGLTPVAGVGAEFNPEIHEAVEIVPVPAEQDDQVIEELQTGYKFGDRLLRPARVRVGRSKG